LLAEFNIFFSGIGVDTDANSKRSEAIFKSEKYISENLLNSSVIRPGVIIGVGDNFLKNLLPIFKISFFIPLFGGGKSSFQPVFIDDVSLGINKIIKNRKSGNYIYEFFGPHIFTYKKFYSLIAHYFGVSRFLVPIPFIIAKIIVFILEKTPYPIINREQLRLFTKDNIAVESHDQLLDLKITAQDTKEILRRIIIKNS
jgi:NADH dehydrogenase